MPVHGLSEQHFSLVGQQKKSMILNISQQPVLVFFKTNECPACSNFEPLFNSLSNNEKRVIFAILNLSQYKNVAKMSTVTTTPISAVPFILLYISGKPFARFTGKKDVQSLTSFIGKALGQAGGGGAQGQQTSVMGGQQRYVAPQQPSQQQYGGPMMSAMNGNKAPVKPMSSGTGSGYTLDETDDEECLLTPDAIVPYNVAWQLLDR